MTLPFTPLHPLDELRRACHQYPGGMEALASRMAIRSVQTLYKKLSTTVPDFHVGYPDELDGLLRCLEEAHVPGWDATIHALCWRYGGVFVRLPESGLLEGEALGQAVMEVVRDAGAVVSATEEAMRDDRAIDSREFARIDQKFESLASAVAGWRERVKSMHQDALAKGLVR